MDCEAGAIGADGEEPFAYVMTINRPDDLDDIGNLGLTVPDGKRVLARHGNESADLQVNLVIVGHSAHNGIAAWISQSDAAPHGGESVIDLLERISGWLDVLKREDGRIVAVTHPAVIRAAIVLGIDAKPMFFWRIDIAPLCRVSIQGNASHWTLRSITP